MHSPMRAVLLPLVLFSNVASAQWLAGYSQRQAIDVSHATALTDFQVLVIADTSLGVRPGCPDVRFTSADAVTVLPHWLESGCGTRETRLWVRAPSIGASSRLYLYSGSATAAGASSPTAVNLFYDTFDTDPEAPARWTDVFRFSGSTADEFVWQRDAGHLLLTTALQDLGGGATFATIDPAWEDGWAVAFRFRAGAGTGADGIGLGFFHRGNGGKGGSLAVNREGYALEVDNFQGDIEPNANHLAVVTTLEVDAGEDYVLHDRYDTLATEDDQWHDVLVEFHQGRITVALDDAGVVLDHTRTWNKTHRRLVFGAGTGGQTNVHRIDDVVLRKAVRPAPSVVLGALERFDAGVDAGSPGDAGTQADAGMQTDAGMTTDGPSELFLSAAEPSVVAGETSGLISVRVRNAQHVEVPVPADLAITFTSTSARGGFLQRLGDKPDQPFTLTLAAGGSATGVYYQDFAVGLQTLRAEAVGLAAANAPIEVKAAAASGCGCGTGPSLLWLAAVLVTRRRGPSSCRAGARPAGRAPRGAP